MANLNDNNEPTKVQLQRWENQAKIVFASFYERPKTMYQVEKETEIMRPSICRFVAEWKRKDSIRIVRKGLDPFTRCTAQFLSTNPMHWPQQPEQVKTDRFGQALLFQ
jgi:hypothetical protein